MSVRWLLVIVLATARLLAPTAAMAQEHPSTDARGVPSDAEGQRAFLDVTVNTVEKGDTLVVLRDGDILVAAAWLADAGVERLDGRRETIDGQEYVSLRSLSPVITFQFDERLLRLALTVAADRLGATVRDFRASRPADIVYRRDRSAFVNYAVDFGADIDLFSEAGVSVGGALLSTTLTSNSRRSVGRGLTALTIDDRARIRRWAAGDSFAATGLLGGHVLLGGITVTRDFTVDPYFVRQPTLSLSTPVTAPSTLEVHVNGRLIREEVVAPGQLDVRNLPLTTGHNDTRIVLRDPFGGTRDVDTSFYSTASALAAGVHDYQYGLGFRRESLTTQNWRYAEPVLLGRHRVGVTDVWTAGGRVEATRDLVSGGALVTARLPFGVVDGALAASRNAGTTGHAAAVAYTYSARPGSVGASARVTSERYATVSLGALDARAPLELRVFAGTNLAGRFQVSAQHSYVPQPDASVRQRTELSGSTRVAREAQFLATVARVRDGAGDGYEATASLTMTFGARTSVTTTINGGGDGTVTSVDLQRSLPIGSGVGYQMRTPDALGSLPSGAVQYQGSHGRYELRADTVGRSSRVSGSVAGAIVGIGGGLFATRPVRGSYALVQVPGVKDVRGYASHQEIGRTDSRGNFFVPDLLPYYGNVLNIADSDVPLDYIVSGVQATVAPPYRGGALVRFPVRRIQRSEGRVLVVAGGTDVVPTYGQLTVTAEGRTMVSPLGTGGEFYFENLAPGSHRATVEYAGGSCAFTITVPDLSAVTLAGADGGAAELGVIRCQAGSR